MQKYNMVCWKIWNLQLGKLKSSTKYSTRVILKVSVKTIGNANFPYILLLSDKKFQFIVIFCG